MSGRKGKNTQGSANKNKNESSRRTSSGSASSRVSQGGNRTAGTRQTSTSTGTRRSLRSDSQPTRYSDRLLFQKLAKDDASVERDFDTTFQQSFGQHDEPSKSVESTTEIEEKQAKTVRYEKEAGENNDSRDDEESSEANSENGKMARKSTSTILTFGEEKEKLDVSVENQNESEANQTEVLNEAVVDPKAKVTEKTSETVAIPITVAQSPSISQAANMLVPPEPTPEELDEKFTLIVVRRKGITAKGVIDMSLGEKSLFVQADFTNIYQEFMKKSFPEKEFRSFKLYCVDIQGKDFDSRFAGQQTKLVQAKSTAIKILEFNRYKETKRIEGVKLIEGTLMKVDIENVIETSRVIKEAIEVSGEENIPVNIVIDGHWHKRVILFMKYIHSPTKIDDKDVDYRLFPVAEFLECEDVIEDMTRRFENLNHNEEDDIKVILSAMSYGIYETVIRRVSKASPEKLLPCWESSFNSWNDREQAAFVMGLLPRAEIFLRLCHDKASVSMELEPTEHELFVLIRKTFIDAEHLGAGRKFAIAKFFMLEMDDKTIMSELGQKLSNQDKRSVAAIIGAEQSLFGNEQVKNQLCFIKDLGLSDYLPVAFRFVTNRDHAKYVLENWNLLDAAMKTSVFAQFRETVFVDFLGASQMAVFVDFVKQFRNNEEIAEDFANFLAIDYKADFVDKIYFFNQHNLHRAMFKYLALASQEELCSLVDKRELEKLSPDSLETLCAFAFSIAKNVDQFDVAEFYQKFTNATAYEHYGFFKILGNTKIEEKQLFLAGWFQCNAKTIHCELVGDRPVCFRNQTLFFLAIVLKLCSEFILHHLSIITVARIHTEFFSTTGEFFDYIFGIDLTAEDIPVGYDGFRKSLEKFFLDSEIWNSPKTKKINKLILSDRYRITEKFSPLLEDFVEKSTKEIRKNVQETQNHIFEFCRTFIHDQRASDTFKSNLLSLVNEIRKTQTLEPVTLEIFIRENPLPPMAIPIANTTGEPEKVKASAETVSKKSGQDKKASSSTSETPEKSTEKKSPPKKERPSRKKNDDDSSYRDSDDSSIEEGSPSKERTPGRKNDDDSSYRDSDDSSIESAGFSDEDETENVEKKKKKKKTKDSWADVSALLKVKQNTSPEEPNEAKELESSETVKNIPKIDPLDINGQFDKWVREIEEEKKTLQEQAKSTEGNRKDEKILPIGTSTPKKAIVQDAPKDEVVSITSSAPKEQTTESAPKDEEAIPTAISTPEDKGTRKRQPESTEVVPETPLKKTKPTTSDSDDSPPEKLKSQNEEKNE